MDRRKLVQLLVARGEADKQVCEQLSATKFIPAPLWEQLKWHEQMFLRCYSAGASTRTSVLVGRSAAQIHGMWVISRRDELVELAHRAGHPPSTQQTPPGTVYRHMTVPDIDIMTIPASDPAGAGSVLSVTSPARTAVDIARLHGAREGVVAMDSLMMGESMTNKAQLLKALADVVKRLSGKKGIGHARRALELCSEVSESPYESLFRVILSECGIEVQEQMWIGPRYRVDFLIGKVIVEIDGHMKYEQTPHDVVLKQMERENWLREQGYEVIRIFPSEILRDERACVQRVLDLRARADTRGPVRTPATRYRPR